MKQFKKLAIFAIAIVAVLALSIVAWAEGDEGQTTRPGIPFEQDATDPNLYSISFTKEIAVTGGTGLIYAPSISYSYSATDVKDSLEGDGDVPAVTIPDPVSFTSSISAANGGVFEATGKIYIDLGDNARPGVYMQEIEESTNVVKGAAGITAPENYNNKRYLVVVLGDPDETDAVDECLLLTVYLYKTSEAGQTVANKTTGWMVGTDTGDTYDKYETTTVTVQKIISGAYADKNHEFPFQLEVDCGNGAKVTYYKNSEGSPTAMKTPVTYGLANQGQVTITGVPVNVATPAQVKVTETNNTQSVYKLTTSGLDTQFNQETVDPNGGTKTGTLTVNSASALYNIVYTNKLEDISATGLALRVAPYAIVVGAGAVLFAVSRRRKENAC